MSAILSAQTNRDGLIVYTADAGPMGDGGLLVSPGLDLRFDLWSLHELTEVSLASELVHESDGLPDLLNRLGVTDLGAAGTSITVSDDDHHVDARRRLGRIALIEALRRSPVGRGEMSWWAVDAGVAVLDAIRRGLLFEPLWHEQLLADLEDAIDAVERLFTSGHRQTEAVRGVGELVRYAVENLEDNEFVRRRYEAIAEDLANPFDPQSYVSTELVFRGADAVLGRDRDSGFLTRTASLSATNREQRRFPISWSRLPAEWLDDELEPVTMKHVDASKALISVRLPEGIELPPVLIAEIYDGDRRVDAVSLLVSGANATGSWYIGSADFDAVTVVVSDHLTDTGDYGTKRFALELGQQTTLLAAHVARLGRKVDAEIDRARRHFASAGREDLRARVEPRTLPVVAPLIAETLRLR